MPESRARVVETRPGAVLVEILGGAGCGHCAPGGTCASGILTRVFPLRPRRFLASDPLGVRPGDEVVVAVDDGALWRSSLAVYAVGLAGVLGGALAGASMLPGAGDAGAAGGAAAGLLVAAGLIRRAAARTPAPLPRVIRAVTAAAVSFSR